MFFIPVVIPIALCLVQYRIPGLFYNHDACAFWETCLCKLCPQRPLGLSTVLRPSGHAACSLEVGTGAAWPRAAAAAPALPVAPRDARPCLAPARATAPLGVATVSVRPGAGRTPAEGAVRRARAGRGGFRAGQPGPARWAGKLLRARGRSAVQGQGRKGKRGTLGAPWPPPSRSWPHRGSSRRRGQLRWRGFCPGPAPGWGLRDRRPPTAPVFRAACAAARLRPRSGHCDPGVPAAPLEARRTEGPLLRVWRAPGPGDWNRPP